MHDFFKTESARALHRFNRIFSGQATFNIRLRYRALLMLISLWQLEQKIVQKPGKSNIQKYMKKLTALNRFFDQYSKERRVYDNSSPKLSRHLGGVSNIKQHGRSMPAMRQHLHHHMASTE